MKKFIIFAAAALMLAACAQDANVQTGNDPVSTVDGIIMSRRSIRNYKDAAISRETLNEILKCGINAPNGMARQAYEIRVIEGDFIDHVSAAVVKDNPQIGSRPGFKNIFVNAPCVVCIAYDTTYDLAQVDCGLLGENIILSAWARGIGSCCLGMPVRQMQDSPSAQPFLEALDFSEGYQLLYCIALGTPDEEPAARPRKEDKIRFIE